MADFLISSFGDSIPYARTLSSLIKCLSGLLLKLNVEVSLILLKLYPII